MAPPLYDKFFTKKSAASYSCNVCGAILAASVGKVSNLNKHLRTVHKDIKEAAEAKFRDQATERQTNLNKFTHASPAAYKKGSVQDKRLTNLLVQAVADGYLPLTIVERGSFKEFVNGLDPRYDMPGRKGLTSSVVAAAEECRARRSAVLKKAMTVSITLDLWSNRRLRSFLGETAHFITEEAGQLQLQSCMLACRRFDERHTAANIAWHHQAILDETGVAAKVAVAVTDSAANMRAAFRISLCGEASASGADSDGEETADLDQPDADDELSPVSVEDVLSGDSGDRALTTTRVACACHTLQLAVRDGLKKVPSSVARATARVTSFVASVKRSTLAAEIMDRQKQNVYVPTVTRWSSELRSIQSYLALRQETLSELVEGVPSLATKVVDEAGRRALEELAKVLTPLAEATDALQGEKDPTGSSVLPTVRILRLRLSTLAEELSGHGATVARALLAAVNCRFQQYDTIFKAATFLDPRWKLGVLAQSAAERAQIQVQVEEELLGYLQMLPPPSEERGSASGEPSLASTSSASPAASQPATSCPVAAQAPSDSGDGENQPPPAKRGFFDLLDEGADDPPPVVTLTLRQRLITEMDAYMREAREDRGVAGRALMYWSGQQATKPLLRHCARHYLAIPASSAPSERLFSVAGRFFCPSRSRLSPEVFEALMTVKSDCSVSEQ